MDDLLAYLPVVRATTPRSHFSPDSLCAAGSSLQRLAQRPSPRRLPTAATRAQAKSRLYLFLGNPKAANREAKGALVLAAEGGAHPAVVELTCLQAHFAKAQLELSRGNAGKALAVLASATEGEAVPGSLRALQLNNAGIVFNRQARAPVLSFLPAQPPSGSPLASCPLQIFVFHISRALGRADRRT